MTGGPVYLKSVTMSLRSILAEEGLVASVLTEQDQAERELILLRMEKNRSAMNPFINEYDRGVFNIRLWTANRSDSEPKTWADGMFRVPARLRGFGMTFNSKVEAEQELKSTVLPDMKSIGDGHYIVGW